MRSFALRLVPVAAVAMSLVGVACNEDGLQMTRKEPTPRRDPFLGPIPTGFVNAVDATSFQAMAGTEAQRLTAAVDGLLLPALIGQGSLALQGEAVGEDLPDINRCDGLRVLMGGFLKRKAVEEGGADAALELVGKDFEAQACNEALRSIGASSGGAMALMVDALHNQLGNLSNMSLADDACTSATDDAAKSKHAALGFRFRPVDASDSSYLHSFAVPSFVATLEGGANGSNMALRSEVELRSTAYPPNGARERMRHWAALASYVVPAAGTLETHKGELLETIVNAADGSVANRALTRRSTLHLAYGGTPSLYATTHYSSFDVESVVASWDLTLRLAALDSKSTELELTSDRDGVAKRWRMRLTRASDGDAARCEILAGI